MAGRMACEAHDSSIRVSAACARLLFFSFMHMSPAFLFFHAHVTAHTPGHVPLFPLLGPQKLLLTAPVLSSTLPFYTQRVVADFDEGNYTMQSGGGYGSGGGAAGGFGDEGGAYDEEEMLRGYV